MTWYELWLFLHISAVVLWIGGAVAVQYHGGGTKQASALTVTAKGTAKK